MTAVREHRFEHRDALARALVDITTAAINEGIHQRGSACLMVSGGSTPQPVYRLLASQPLDWHKVSVALVDERWVASDHPASNERFIRHNLLLDDAAAARFIGMKTPAPTASAGLDECQQRYRALPAQPDFCLLGMGADGHTASLFPHALGLTSALAPEAPRCVAISAQQSDVTGPYTERMSLSAAAILACRQIVVLITGEEKWAVYRRALAGRGSMEMPVRAVLQQSHTPVSVYWAP